MRIARQGVGAAVLGQQGLHLSGHRDIALPLDGAAGAAAAAERGEGEVLGENDLDVAVVVPAPGPREVPALREFRSPGFGGLRRVALDFADDGLCRRLPLGRDLGRGGCGTKHEEQEDRDGTSHGGAPQYLRAVLRSRLSYWTRLSARITVASGDMSQRICIGLISW